MKDLCHCKREKNAHEAVGMCQKDIRAEEEDEADQEEKMEKFYELIRRYKEAKDHHQRLKFRIQKQEEDHDHVQENTRDNCNKKKVKVEDGDHAHDDKMMASWMPSFKWEDFKDVFQDDHVVSTSYNNCNKKRKVEDDDHDDHGLADQFTESGLDLNLGL